MTNTPSKLAVITGPTSGIGLAFAHKLAKQNYKLLLIARSKTKVHHTAKLLKHEYNIDVNYLVADLANDNDICRVENKLKNLNNIELLINNAGFGLAGFFMEISLEEQLKMLNVHIACTIRFSKAVLPAMIRQKKGYIINLSSFAAFMELPGTVMYSTTKAAIIKFSQTLQSEVVKYGIKIQALSPGFTPTAFHTSINRETEFIDRVPSFLWTPIQQVVDTSLARLNTNKVICIPGTINTMLFWLNKAPFLSRWIQHIAAKRQKEQACSTAIIANEDLQKTAATVT
ncbi:SDR family NAD(P)-dependent oxidoreductase [Carboxylicivirga sp. RSCT41]|uniref:SDR family NAD(P)-dependent oxidoreductase n=1 Tax=Carboxylicivirga agarovorans TaxID=3417570 RepID=UPI003D3325A6